MSQNLQKFCRDKAFYSFGTAKIFERRLQRISRYRDWITYLGIVVPLLVGSIALSFGSEWLPYLAIPAGVLGTVQLALSCWSLVSKWDDKHAYALSAIQAHTRLFNLWDRLDKRPPVDIEQQAHELEAEDHRQEQADLAQNISDKEKRYAMRAALYHFGLPCVKCKQSPVSMQPKDCDTCGNF